MKQLSIDIESFSSVDLAKCGVYKYCESPDFAILLFGYAVDGGEVQVTDLACGEEIPAGILAALEDDTVTKWAFNSSFERVCLSRYLGLPTGEYLDPASWRCSMVWSAYMGLPQSLADVGTVLGLEKQKLTEGKDLIRYFCVPCKPTKANGSRTRNLPKHDWEKWSRFKAYNMRDVEAEMQIQQKLSRFPVPEAVWEEYWLDQEINDRGIGVDMEMVTQAIAIDARAKAELTAAMQELTGLENPNSVMQMKHWLSENGLQMDILGKKEVAAALKTAPEPLRRVLTLRQQLAKSSVKKYQAMENAVCTDSRARGMFKFYGANRTGRYSGRLVQLQNLPQNHIPDLAEARGLVAQGNFDALSLLYDDIPDTLSQLIRTAFVPQYGRKFIVADFSAIEARVIAWLAGEQWRMDAFAKGEDIYCASASQMFGVPVVKHGVNGHLRQKGKIAELACIAEGQLVLTDHGLIPIEDVTTDDRIWDGESWVKHDGVIFKGEREVITYEGLRATPDHLVWVEGEPRLVQLGIAAASGAHLIQTGNGRKAVRLGKDYQSREAVEQGDEPLLCTNRVHGLRKHPMAEQEQPYKRKVEGMSAMFPAETNSAVAGQKVDSRKAALRKHKGRRLSQLRCKGNHLRFPKRNCCRTVSDCHIRTSGKSNGDRPDRQQRQLCTRESSVCIAPRKQPEQTNDRAFSVRATILAVCLYNRNPQVIQWLDEGRSYSGRGERCHGEKKVLETHLRTARLYDIRNAGRHHRFTVSGKLVHNCGYGGSVGAMKAMGAADMGLSDEELRQIVEDWRTASPNITNLWWAVDRAVKECIRKRLPTETHGIRFEYKSGFLFIVLPSGRRLAYVKPRIDENKFGGESVTYMGVGGTKKWERLESYGPKFVENIVQAISRDILCYAMRTLSCCSIVAHVHDELIIEADRRMSLSAVCEQMGRTPPWAEGLLLRADGYECEFYQKD